MSRKKRKKERKNKNIFRGKKIILKDYLYNGFN